jgi:CheY-like chemotaxis protein
LKTFGSSFEIFPLRRPTAWHCRPVALVVDDDPDIRELLQIALGNFFGCQVELAHSASEAIQKIEGRNFSFVVCDLMLGNESGMDVFYYLRNHPEHLAPFVLFSGNTSSLLPFERDQIVSVEKTDLNRLLDVIEGMGFPSV